MTTWPDVVAAAARFGDYGAGSRAREVRMSATTAEELARRLNLRRPELKPEISLFGGMQNVIYGLPLILDEAMTGTRWEMRGHDGAVIQSGALR